MESSLSHLLFQIYSVKKKWTFSLITTQIHVYEDLEMWISDFSIIDEKISSC